MSRIEDPPDTPRAQRCEICSDSGREYTSHLLIARKIWCERGARTNHAAGESSPAPVAPNLNRPFTSPLGNHAKGGTRTPTTFVTGS